MALTTNNILKVKINGQWAVIPSIQGPKGDPGFTYAEVTISVADWNNTTTCTKQVQGLTAQDHVIISPNATSMSDVINAVVYCSAQGNGTLTFTCSAIPSSAITFEVMYGV